MLGWSAIDLAEQNGQGSASVKRYEIQTGIPSANTSVLLKLKTTLEIQGIEFSGDPSVNPGVSLNLGEQAPTND